MPRPRLAFSDFCRDVRLFQFRPQQNRIGNDKGQVRRFVPLGSHAWKTEPRYLSAQPVGQWSYVGADILNSEAVNIFEGGDLPRARHIRDVADLVETPSATASFPRCGLRPLRVMRKDVIIEAHELPIPVLGPAQHRASQLTRDKQISKSARAHQPFI